MAGFEYESEEIKAAHLDLIASTDGSEPCYDATMIEAEPGTFLGESVTDLYVENWTNRGVSPEVAAEMCAPCHVKDKCAAYALLAKEGYGIWGGTTPRMRGIPRGYKGK